MSSNNCIGRHTHACNKC